MLDHVAETTISVDREQMESFMHEYNHSPNKKQFLTDKSEQRVDICMVCLIFLLSLFFRPSDWLITACQPMRKMAEG